MKGNIGIEFIVNSVDGLFLVDNCIFSQNFTSFYGVENYSEIDFLPRLQNIQKRIQKVSQNENIRTINEVIEEFANYIILIKDKYNFLNNQLEKEFPHTKKEDKAKQELLKKFYQLIQEIPDEMSSKIVNSERIERINEGIKLIQYKNPKLQGIEKPGYRGTDEKLVAAALLLGNSERKTSILTRDNKILNILEFLRKDKFPGRFFDARDRTKIQYSQVRAFYFDQDLKYVRDVEYPKK